VRLIHSGALMSLADGILIQFNLGFIIYDMTGQNVIAVTF